MNPKNATTPCLWGVVTTNRLANNCQEHLNRSQDLVSEFQFFGVGCPTPAEHRLAAQDLCNRHYWQLIQPIRMKQYKIVEHIPMDAEIGFGKFIAPNPDYPLRHRSHRYGYLVCADADCGRTWVGVEGDGCIGCADRWKRDNL